jgi:hypothetical protein
MNDNGCLISAGNVWVLFLCLTLSGIGFSIDRLATVLATKQCWSSP